MNRRWLLLLPAAVLFLWNIGGYDLWAPDEPYFAEGAREMVVDGKWVVPHVNGVVTTDKPPLFFWAIGLVSMLFGSVTSLTARLPSVLASIGTVILTVRLGHRLWSPRVGVYAGLLLTTNYLFWDKARSAQTDALLCFLILSALSAFEAFRSGDADGRRAGLLFWFAAALAVLNKGPVGLLLPVGAAVLILLADRTPGRLRRFAPISGPVLFVAVLACWIVPANLWDPEQYSVWGALKEHFVDRAVQGMHHVQPPWYYAKALPLQLAPWTGLLPGALLLAWRRRTPGDRFALTICAFVVVFFSLSTEKRDLYVLPAYPAFILLFAALVDRVAPAASGDAGGSVGLSRRWVTIPQAISGLLLVLVGAALVVLRSEFEQVEPWIAILLGALILITGAAVLAAAVRGQGVASVAAAGIGIAAVYLVAASVLLPALNPVKSARAFAGEVKALTAPSRDSGDVVVAFWMRNIPEALAFYSDGVYVKETSDWRLLAEHLRQPRKVYAVVNLDRVDLLPPEISRRLVHVATARLSRVDLALVHNAGGS